MRKYLDPSKYFRKIRNLFNFLLAVPAEYTSALILAKGPPLPPVFLLGPPRCGSTLIMQVITDRFNVGYISNQHCQWFGAPVVAEYLFSPLSDRSPSSYKSNYGRTNGKDAPAECGAWWYRFFRRDPGYVRLEEVSPRKMRKFLRSLRMLEAVIGLPMVFKNLYASLRLEPIAHYIPDALFIVVERDWIDNGQSILRGRKDAVGDYGQWWSVPPPNVDRLSNLSPVQQVVGQVESIHELINRDIERLTLEKQVFRIRYEDFCEDVHGTLSAFHAFMASHGIELKHRFEVPAQFPVRRPVKIPQAMYEELQAEVARRTGQAAVSQWGDG